MIWSKAVTIAYIQLHDHIVLSHNEDRMIAGHHHAMIVCIPVTMGVEKLKCESWPAVTELQ